MIIPYSTDAPIYYFPWMTITLIVVNCVTFALTGMGMHNEGWLLQYGNGLHPLEWVAYSFLHFGPVHLLGNMFFLWAFGIVVEGKLGWWKFLSIYLAIGIVGGFLIQVAMLGYQIPLDDLAAAPLRGASWLEPSRVFAQDASDGMSELMDDDEEKLPGEQEDQSELTPEQMQDLRKELTAHFKPGAGGASLIVFSLLGIVLVWAPKNEVTCFFLAGFRAGTFELEYLYFCGFKIACEVLGTIWGVRGFEVTSEVAHLLGVALGFSVAAMFLKLSWVDCENWDLFAYAQNKHGSMVQVGAWQEAATVSYRRDRKIATPEGDDTETFRHSKPNKKRRPKAKMVALESFEDEMPFEETTSLDEPPQEQSRRTTAQKPMTPTGQGLAGIRAALKEGRWNDALAEFRRQRAADPAFELPKTELRCLADGFFKAHNVRDSKAFLEEYIARFPDDADRCRVKLAVLYVKFLKRPTAALKLLSKVDRKVLPEDFQSIHQQAARQAQQMIADGVGDAI